jgi:hypothetical protein
LDGNPTPIDADPFFFFSPLYIVVLQLYNRR